MRTYRWGDGHWYEDTRSLWKRLRQWVVWIGGWETADGRWRFRVPGFGPRKWIRIGPTPVSFFGHSVTLHGWGWNMRVPGGWLVYTRKNDSEGRRLYISHNGTPNSAHHWIIGAPHRVREAVARKETA